MALAGAAALGGLAYAGTETTKGVLNYLVANKKITAEEAEAYEKIQAQKQVAAGQQFTARFESRQQTDQVENASKYNYLMNIDQLKQQGYESKLEYADLQNQRRYQKAMQDAGWDNQFKQNTLYLNHESSMYDKGTGRYQDAYEYQRDLNQDNILAKNVADTNYYHFSENAQTRNNALTNKLDKRRVGLQSYEDFLLNETDRRHQMTDRYGMTLSQLAQSRDEDTKQWVVRALMSGKTNPDAAFDSATTQRINQSISEMSGQRGEPKGGYRSEINEQKAGEAQKLATVEGIMQGKGDLSQVAAPKDSLTTKTLSSELPPAKRPKYDVSSFLQDDDDTPVETDQQYSNPLFTQNNYTVTTPNQTQTPTTSQTQTPQATHVDYVPSPPTDAGGTDSTGPPTPTIKVTAGTHAAYFSESEFKKWFGTTNFNTAANANYTIAMNSGMWEQLQTHPGHEHDGDFVEDVMPLGDRNAATWGTPHTPTGNGGPTIKITAGNNAAYFSTTQFLRYFGTSAHSQAVANNYTRVMDHYMWGKLHQNPGHEDDDNFSAVQSLADRNVSDWSASGSPPSDF